MTQTIPAEEIKRRGLGVVDEALKKGPVHVTREDKTGYVILSEEEYKSLVEVEEPYEVRIQKSLEDVKAGRVHSGTSEDLIQQIGLDD